MSSSFEQHHWRELLILDTGVIRELVLFHAVQHLGFEKLRNELRFIPNPESYDICGRFIGSFKRKTTSASVVAELNYWIRQTEHTGQEKLWNRVYEEFLWMGMDEKVVKFLDMEIDLVTCYGPVDVSLLDIAKKHANLNPLILTIDRELQGEGLRARLRVQHLRELTQMS